ncbi:hypothetical protein WA1_44575 [Scytonema hofmannii PCC 7110]|uniref:Uncharacterized protein n=1 Tax=Scytonema hofmannii PCC 7110 TaxID=128403 RepID=A0A139WWD9_9CYAN|nr:hypothetical protein WA1_44575 [Scytonema hofmannii PCC 7110]
MQDGDDRHSCRTETPATHAERTPPPLLQDRRGRPSHIPGIIYFLDISYPEMTGWDRKNVPFVFVLCSLEKLEQQNMVHFAEIIEPQNVKELYNKFGFNEDGADSDIAAAS